MYSLTRFDCITGEVTGTCKLPMSGHILHIYITPTEYSHTPFWSGANITKNKETYTCNIVYMA